MSIPVSLHSSSKTFRGRAIGWTVAAWLPRLFVPRIGFRRARAQSAAADGARNRNRIEATVTDSFFDQDRHDVCRNQIPAGTDCRDAEYDMSAK